MISQCHPEQSERSLANHRKRSFAHFVILSVSEESHTNLRSVIE